MAGDAGWGALSLPSVVAGVLVAYASAALLTLAAWAVASWIGVDTTMSTRDWRRLGELGGIGAAIVLLLAFAYGGYTAGRMARRGGLRNGLLVAAAGIALAAGIAAAGGGLGSWGPISRELQRLGSPTTWRQWRDPVFIAGLASLIAVFLGALAGGRAGERWHAKLLSRALDPMIGPEAAVRAAAARASRAEELHQAAAARVANTTAVREPIVVEDLPTDVSETGAGTEPGSGTDPDVTAPATVSGIDTTEVFKQEAEPRA
jgi:hypothetical protein